MKHIVYLHQYFRVPSQGGSTRSYWIARALVDEGYKVTMVTSGDADGDSKYEFIDGIHVVRLKVPYDQKMSVFRRFRSFFDFMVRSTIYSLFLKDVDMVFVTSTPLSIGIPALMLKWLRRIPYIFEVRDLWPRVPIEMGMITNTALKKTLVYLEYLVYKNALEIVALSPGMEQGVKECCPKAKVSMIPNMSKVDIFYPRRKDQSLIDRLGLSRDSFKVIHFGSIGRANGIENILSNLEICNSDKLVEFVFVGGGSEEERLKKQCKDKGLRNVFFLGAYSLSDTSNIVNLCDVSLVSFANIPVLYTNSPNKLFDSLSAGKAIIVNSAGWTKDLVENYHCGLYVDPDSPEDLIHSIELLASDKALLGRMEENSIHLAQTKFDKEILCSQVVGIFNRYLN